MKSFQELKLPKPLERALADMNFTTPTPIQAQSIPVTLTGRDLIGCAQTGTGKTAAFGIPMIMSLMQNHQQNGLILVPTRELAAQVTEVLRDLTKYLPEIRVVTIIGGMSMQPQLRALSKNFRIIVATPGRLVDHLQRKNTLLQRCSFLVLDEADRMLDMGFAPQLKMIFPRLERDRQTLLFSATLAPEIKQLAEKLLRNPIQVQVGEVSRAAPKIDQQIKRLKQDDKPMALLEEINARQGTLLAFCRTQRRVDRITKFLVSYGVSVASIHGGKTQGQRTRALEGFRDGTFRILLATDIAARGIDVEHVAHVVNVDLPEVPEDYVHRIGRTARAGRSGESMSFICAEEQDNWRQIEKLLGKKFQETPSFKKDSVKAQTPAPVAPVQGNAAPAAFVASPKPGKPKQGYPRGKPVDTTASASKFSPFATQRAELPKGIRFKDRF